MIELKRESALVAVGVVALLLAGCGPGTPVLETEPPVVTVSQPLERKDIIDYDQYTGRVEAAETVEVRARVRGELINIYFKDGAPVQAGAPLFDLDPRTYKTDVAVAKARKANAEASLKFAEAEYQRNLRLAATDAAAARDVESWLARKGIATAEVHQAEAQIERANLDVEFAHIKAPITGKISRSLVTKGNLVNAGGGDTLLTTIVSVDPIFVYFDVDEHSLKLYRDRRAKEVGNDDKTPFVVASAVGLMGSPLGEGPLLASSAIILGKSELIPPTIPVFLSLIGEDNHLQRKGVIDFAENRINPSTGTIRVRGVFPNKDGKLTPGQFARVRLPSKEKYPGVLVTDTAIGTDQGSKYLLIVNDENKVEYRPVIPGRLDGDLRIFPLGAGLKPGEWVIVNGVQRVRPGIVVKPERVPMPTLPTKAESRKPKAEKENPK